MSVSTTGCVLHAQVYIPKSPTDLLISQVGGLPLAELNHLEIQFLILNDFRLAVPVEDLEAYATMLVEFYAREVVSQQSPTSTSPTTAAPPTSTATATAATGAA